MLNKKRSHNLQRSSLSAPRPAAPRAVPGVAPVIVPAVAYRGASRTAPAAAPALAPATAYRGAYRAAPAVSPRAAPPPSSRGRTQGGAMKGDMALAPRAAPRATPRTTPAPHGHRGDEWYKVFVPEFDTVAYDPLDPPKRYHTGIFVETDTETLRGALFHVTGDIIANSGMRFEVRDNYVPGASRYFHRTTEIGWIRKADYPRIRGILEALPKPTKQQGIDFWSKDPAKRNKLTWTKQNGDLYGPGEQRRPIMKCNEWTHQLAIPKLRGERILQ
ncbi:hypothetical protein N7481_008428 [Penicillium waksmanii]|uniref:uncharacterized protein n=1 Tax=Penicillium waksmanii TaxID=69791 RepID=UPI0025474679|nr:uncharacterized protein N7481_008428 [Penicillium waksmanii]KAJ5981130.1 hypothetical protein N7481_008428 [Penicillium waksmanii]